MRRGGSYAPYRYLHNRHLGLPTSKKKYVDLSKHAHSRSAAAAKTDWKYLQYHGGKMGIVLQLMRKWMTPNIYWVYTVDGDEMEFELPYSKRFVLLRWQLMYRKHDLQQPPYPARFAPADLPPGDYLPGRFLFRP